MTAGRLPVLALPALLVATAALAEVPVERLLLLSEEPAVVEMRTAALIMSGQQGGVLPIAVVAIPDGTCDDGAAAAASKCRFTALVEIDGAALLESSPGEGRALPVEIFAYVLGTELDVLDQQSLSLDLGFPAHRQLLVNTGLKAFLRLEVAPGDHQLRVLVHAGGAFGLRGLNLRPAAPTAGSGIRVSAPVFHELAGPWLMAAPAGVELPLPPAFGLEGDAPLPAARPQMPAGGSIAGQVVIAGADASARNLIALLRRPGEARGDQAVEVPLTVDDPIASTGLERVAVSFSAPPEVGPGLWEIAVATAAGARSDFVPIFVEHPPSGTAGATSEAGAADLTTVAQKPKGGNQRKLARSAGDGYARALRQLADGDQAAARSTLMASEESVVAALDAEAVDVLSQAELRVLASLPDADWGCLLPVILLHLDVSRAYRERGRRILAHHATRMTVHLAGAYADKLADPQAAAEAARALTSLAGYFQHGSALSQAEKLYTRALELAADDAALLGLATLYEKRGLIDRAVPVFERLAAERPEHAEGALRLAINRARAGRGAAARAALERLAARRDDDWVTLLAHQELARLLVDDGRMPQAADVLRRGLARWPDQPTLQLQLAWVLDALDRPEASLELLENLASASAHPAGERSRYNRWPSDLLAASRHALAEVAGSRQGDLRRWLSGQGAGDG